MQFVAAQHTFGLEPATDRAGKRVEVVVDDLAVELAKPELGEQVIHKQERAFEWPDTGVGPEERRNVTVAVTRDGVVCGHEAEPLGLVSPFDDELRQNAVPQLADECFRSRRRSPLPPMWRRALVGRELEEEVVVARGHGAQPDASSRERHRGRAGSWRGTVEPASGQRGSEVLDHNVRTMR